MGNIGDVHGRHRRQEAPALDGIAPTLRPADPHAACQHWREALTLHVEIGLSEAGDVHRHPDLVEPQGRTVLEGRR